MHKINNILSDYMHTPFY